MHSIVINGDRLEIKEFKRFLWVKNTDIKELPEEFKNICFIKENTIESADWYFYENDEYILYAFLSDIGTEPHPLIEFSCESMWYNSNLGGVYITGKDKKTGALFAPVID